MKEWTINAPYHPLTLARLRRAFPLPRGAREKSWSLYLLQRAPSPSTSKKCAAASSRGAGASLVTQKEKVGSRPLSRNTAGTGRTPPGRTARSYLHHVARLAGARSGAVASSAVSQSRTSTIAWPRFPDAAFAPSERGVHVDCRRTQSRSAGYFGTSGPFCPRDTIDTLCASH